MKISVDDQEIFTLSEIQKKVIQNDIPSTIFDQDMKRRLKWVLLDEKYSNCFNRLKKEWEPKLVAKGISSIPSDPDAFASLVFSQPDYKDRLARDIDQKAQADAAAEAALAEAQPV